MKDSKDIEKILLNDSEYDEIVKSKIEAEFNKEISGTAGRKTVEYITDIKKAPKDKLFSKYAVYEVINKSSKTKSYINGIQAEGYLGARNSDRVKLLGGQVDSFVCGNSYIKFVKIKV